MEKESDTQKETEGEREGKIAYSFSNRDKEENIENKRSRMR